VFDATNMQPLPPHVNVRIHSTLSATDPFFYYYKGNIDIGLIFNNQLTYTFLLDHYIVGIVLF